MAEDDGEHGKSVYVVHNHTGKPMKLPMTAYYNPVPCTWNNSFVSFMFISISNKTVKVIHAVTDAVKLN